MSIIYTITADLSHNEIPVIGKTAESLTGTLEEIQAALIDEALTYDRHFGEFSTWNIDPEDLEDHEEVPPLTPENLKEFATHVWGVHPNHVTIRESA